MKFTCKRCSNEITVSSSNPVDDAIVCPSCGARYRRRRASQPPPTTLAPQRTTAFTIDPHQPTQVLTHDARGALEATSGSLLPAGDAGRPSSAGVSLISQPSSPSGGEFLGRTAERTTFLAGDLVAGRYGIVRFVARGGMGEVYEAEDIELNERVALKTVRGDYGQAAGLAIERLKREIQLARKVTHPNVCRIFDVGRHPSLEGGEDVTFLTMEFLEGATLAGELRRRRGPISGPEALPIVCQLAEGLHAAHRVGIVHRDFKSDNVLLVGRGAEARAVITDFGIARAMRQDPRDSHLTNRGELVGTPAYMAPEQVTGGEIGPATDLYALGIVMFEVLTGQVPFLGDTAVSTAAMRLTTPPPSPRTIVPALDAKWEQAVLRCLERNPADRFSTGLELAQFLRGEETLTETQLAEMEREKQVAIERERRHAEAARQQARAVEAKSRRGYKTRLVLVLVLVAGIGVLAQQTIRQRLRQAALDGVNLSDVQPRRAMAVLNLRNTVGRTENEWLGVAIGEMLATELAGASGELRLVPRANVERVRLEMGVPSFAELTAEQLRLVGRNLGADYLIAGSFLAEPRGDLRLDLQLVQASSGEIVKAFKSDGTQEQLSELVGQAGETLRSELAVTSAASGERRSSLPRSREAARFYAEGLERLHGFEPAAARELLDRAGAAEPNNALIQSARATALASLGYEREALAAAQRAFELAADAPDEERLLFEGQLREAGQQWVRAIEVYQALWRSRPDNLEYGLRLINAQVSGGAAARALDTVDALRRLPEPSRSDPRLDLAEAAASSGVSSSRRQHAAAVRATEKARAQGAKYILAQARLAEAAALRELGNAAESTAAADEALATFQELKNRSGQAAAYGEKAAALYVLARYDESVAAYRSSLDAFEEVGDQGGVLRTLNNVAVIHRAQGKLDVAEKRFREQLALARRLGNELGEAQALNNLGVVLFSQGHLEDAFSHYRQARDLYARLGHKASEGSALANLAAVERWRGNTQAARELIEQALTVQRSIEQLKGQAASTVQLALLYLDSGDLERAAASLRAASSLVEGAEMTAIDADVQHGLGLVAAARGELDQARTLLAAGRQLREKTGARSAAEASILALAEIDLEQGKVDQVLSATAGLVGNLELPSTTREALLATVLLAEAQVEAGLQAEAERTLAAATRRLGDGEFLPALVRLHLTRSRLELRTGRIDGAAAALEQVRARVTASGVIELKLRFTIEDALVVAARGDRDRARALLDAALDTSRQHELGLLAQRAERARARLG